MFFTNLLWELDSIRDGALRAAISAASWRMMVRLTKNGRAIEDAVRAPVIGHEDRPRAEPAVDQLSASASRTPSACPTAPATCAP
jgi:hypothetical protein